MVQLSLRFPTKEQLANIPVGFMVADVTGKTGFLVACSDCTASRATPIYFVNIFPYKQTCCDCGRVLVTGQSSAWCELFVPRKCA